MLIKTVNLIGSGRIAHALGARLMEKCSIVGIYSRNFESAKNLATAVNSVALKSARELSKQADLNLIAVPDDQIENVAIYLDKGIPVVHTSGSVDIVKLAGFNNAGVIYPLQSFSLTRQVNLSEVPFLIESNNQNFLASLHKFVYDQFSSNIKHASSPVRLRVHISAVIANNFVNHLLSISENILRSEQLDLTLLKPLLNETINKAIEIGTNESQTGPARRNDNITLKNHLQSLTGSDKEIYSIISDSIKKRFNS